ncbi:SmpA / OmlA family protein [Flyfo siphovirus Tbat2_3]|nr:SmpA / OmlA family protein [Flyfo siphovirus Tbat2_3]
MLAGCANKIDYNQKSLSLSLGMSKPEVQNVMGSPRRTDVNSERERWIYWNPVMVGFTPIDNEQLAQDRLVVTFVSGKVVKWGQQTIADDITESTQKIYQQANGNPQTVILKTQ